MYVRPPTSARERVNIPENYSGHAFRDRSIYSDMPPPKHIDETQQTRKNESDAIPSSCLDQYHTEKVQFELQSEEINTPDTEPTEAEDPRHTTAPDSETSRHVSSIFSSLFPTLGKGSKHFPFGHGIGSEEILLLAVMMLVYLSGSRDGEGDDELLLLLGLLLFAG